ncbi:hypothetical protein BO94DRAFT_271756 [Aspergillus sclerotioniger CBS 115572]|uniref:Uncharacterized protein n=1 Tax=Aspergillus sclerotioniger CBS 115572 TaxID=1450535 RepID=A0A317X6W9_9EURO|nr:hypothetical protein BO94DRAFT_271756 [Aspergillus sclerotioniger CBS 115572]PWY94376.1 hypothetical protein BO94DRAFT_271756 [Aspergillus sclerotioniger CBS 115572]
MGDSNTTDSADKCSDTSCWDRCAQDGRRGAEPTQSEPITRPAYPILEARLPPTPIPTVAVQPRTKYQIVLGCQWRGGKQARRHNHCRTCVSRSSSRLRLGIRCWVSVNLLTLIQGVHDNPCRGKYDITSRGPLNHTEASDRLDMVMPLVEAS